MADRKRPSLLLTAGLALHTFLYRISNGGIGGHLRNAPMLLLTVRGRKSGKTLTLPLLGVPTDKGYGVIASFGGAPQHPAWYLNLDAAKTAEIQVGGARIPVRAEKIAPDSERYRKIWNDAVALYPDYTTYQARTTRKIPIVELVPTADHPRPVRSV